MAVISTPSGTPTIVYGAGDITIDTLTAGATRAADCTVYIVRYSPHTVVTIMQVEDAHGDGSVFLPTDPVVGDVIEAHAAVDVLSGAGVDASGLLPPTGYTIENGAVGGVAAYHVVLRLTSATNWSVVSTRAIFA